ncbi:MAG TPA: DNA mismatch repair protein MutS, partial [Porphyromonadaceae bacterium]|nr:DNA mismatch repair protein MutS [Porphyromonadaceae bacterium]
MPVTERIAKYRELAENQLNAAARYKKELNANSLLRFFVFLTGSALTYFFHQNTLLAVLFAAVTGVCFLALLARHKNLLFKKAKSEALARIAGNELQAFVYDFSPFDGAPEHVDPAHSFSFDLDIFGERSVFQMLNRTSLAMGKEALAGIVGSPLKDSGEIRIRQLAVKELSEKED